MQVLVIMKRVEGSISPLYGQQPATQPKIKGNTKGRGNFGGEFRGGG